MRPQGADQLERRVLGERDDIIDAGQRGQDLQPLGQGEDRPLVPFQPPHRSVVVDADDQQAALAAGELQQLDMAGMEQVEDAVGEDDRFVLARPASSRFREGAPS